MKPLPDLRAPDDLTELRRWVLWRYEARKGRRTKIPYQTNGKRADITNPDAWSTFEEALAAWRRNPNRYNGIGFVFVKAWARGIVERFADTYMEISPGGQGLKIWARGSLPANVPGAAVGDGSIELYDHARYFAVTGRAFRGAPLEVEDHKADLLWLYQRFAPGRNRWPIQPLPGGQIPHGRQHNTLVSICGTLRARGICEEAIESCLQVVNEKQCEKPGPPENIRRIVESSRKWNTK